MRLSSKALIGLLAVSMSGPCGGQGTSTKTEQVKSEKAIPVEVVLPRYKSLPVKIKAKAKAVVSERLALKALTKAIVKEVYVSPGDQVKVNDPLFELDDRSIQARLEVVKTWHKEIGQKIEFLEKQRESTSRNGDFKPEDYVFLDEDEAKYGNPSQNKQNPAPNANEEQNQNAPDGSSAQLYFENKIKIYRALNERLQAELIQLQLAYKESRKLATIGGLVRQTHVSDGSTVTAGDPLLEIVRIDPVGLEFYVAQDFIPFVDRYTEVEVFYSIDTKEGPKLKKQKAQIALVDPVFDEKNQGYRVLAHTSNPQKNFILAKTYLLDLITRKTKSSLVVPEKALRFDETKPFVFIVKGNQVRQVPVIPSQTFPEKKEVAISGDLHVDDWVIVTENTNLKDKSIIEVTNQDKLE